MFDCLVRRGLSPEHITRVRIPRKNTDPFTCASKTSKYFTDSGIFFQYRRWKKLLEGGNSPQIHDSV